MLDGKLTLTASRPCGTCNACCVGFLTAKIYGTPMKSGRPCKFLDKNCSIYNFRPQLCKDYICEWKGNPIVPDRFKPNNSNVIMHIREKEGYDYLQVFDRNKELHKELYDWIHAYHLQGIYEHVIYNHYTNFPNTYRGNQIVLTKNEKFRMIATEKEN